MEGKRLNGVLVGKGGSGILSGTSMDRFCRQSCGLLDVLGLRSLMGVIGIAGGGSCLHELFNLVGEMLGSFLPFPTSTGSLFNELPLGEG